MKKIPQLKGFDIENNYSFKDSNRLYRIGLKVNTPSVCNWACPYCYAGDETEEKRPSKKQYTSSINDPYKDKEWFEKAKRWIKMAKECGTQAITINGTFEPTTSPFVFDVIKLSRDNDLYVTLVTNGGKIKVSDIKMLRNLDISILTKLNVPIVDIDDTNFFKYSEIQKSLSGLKGDPKDIYLKQLSFINALIDAGFNEGNEGITQLGVESVITNSNIEFLPQLVYQLRGLNIYSHIEVMKVQGFAENNYEFNVGKKDLYKLFAKVKSEDQDNDYEPWEIKPPYIAGSCYQNLFRVDVQANGDVAPCPGISLLLGNLNKSKLVDVLENPDLKIIRDLENNLQGDCKKCELFLNKRCYGGCRGTVYQVLSKLGFSKYDCLTASDPSCHRVEYVLNNSEVTAEIYV